MGHHRCSLYCVLPPYLLEHLLSKVTDPDHRHRLLNSLSMSSFRRGSRQFAARASVRGSAEISIYDAKHSENTADAVLIWRESKGGALTDPDAKNVADFTVATRDFYKGVYGRNSVDDNGYNLNSYIHVGDGWDNAQWDGTEMQYGDGDGIDFNSFTSSIDVIGHELTHGVTQYTSDLAYHAQSGALNESFSDVMGIQIKQHHLNQTVAQADWLIGKGLFKNGDSLRSMKKPGTAYAQDPQPADMDGYVTTSKDNGGVHLNSSIPNRAFYEACAAFDANKNSWETIGPAWYKAFTNLPPNANFMTAAKATVAAAKTFGQKQADAVQAGWSAVKIHL